MSGTVGLIGFTPDSTWNNYGFSWSQPSTTLPNLLWTSIAMSDNGKYQSAVSTSNGNVYLSSNFGVNWTTVSVSAFGSNSISLSSTGQYQSVVFLNNLDTGCVYTSSNFGATWTPRTVIVFGGINYAFTSISVSASGQYQTHPTRRLRGGFGEGIGLKRWESSGAAPGARLNARSGGVPLIKVLIMLVELAFHIGA